MSPEAPYLLADKRDCLNTVYHLLLLTSSGSSGLPLITSVYYTSSEGLFLTAFFIDGEDILNSNMNFPDLAAARAVCLGSHTARGDYGGCDSAKY